MGGPCTRVRYIVGIVGSCRRVMRRWALGSGCRLGCTEQALSPLCAVTHLARRQCAVWAVAPTAMCPCLTSSNPVPYTLHPFLHSALASAMKGGGPWPHRSKPPPVQAPPTLAPSDPLMLSPLKEEPYLFVLRDPEEALQEGVSLQGGSVGKAGAAGRVGGGTPVGSPYANAAASQALARQQARLQGKETGKALQDAWAEEWHGSADADELLVDMSPGMVGPSGSWGPVAQCIAWWGDSGWCMSGAPKAWWAGHAAFRRA